MAGQTVRTRQRRSSKRITLAVIREAGQSTRFLRKENFTEAKGKADKSWPHLREQKSAKAKRMR